MSLCHPKKIKYAIQVCLTEQMNHERVKLNASFPYQAGKINAASPNHFINNAKPLLVYSVWVHENEMGLVK